MCAMCATSSGSRECKGVLAQPGVAGHGQAERDGCEFGVQGWDQDVLDQASHARELALQGLTDMRHRVRVEAGAEIIA